MVAAEDSWVWSSHMMLASLLVLLRSTTATELLWLETCWNVAKCTEVSLCLIKEFLQLWFPWCPPIRMRITSLCRQSQRAQISENNRDFERGWRFRARLTVFDRATHRGPIFVCGEIETSRLTCSSLKIKNFDRDWKFWARLRIVLIVGLCWRSSMANPLKAHSATVGRRSVSPPV